MHIHWFDCVGSTGVALVLVTYFLLQSGRLSGRGMAYSVLNLIGSLLITVSLTYTFNLSSFIIEIFWIGISLYGIARNLRERDVPDAADR